MSAVSKEQLLGAFNNAYGQAVTAREEYSQVWEELAGRLVDERPTSIEFLAKRDERVAELRWLFSGQPVKDAANASREVYASVFVDDNADMELRLAGRQLAAREPSEQLQSNNPILRVCPVSVTAPGEFRYPKWPLFTAVADILTSRISTVHIGRPGMRVAEMFAVNKQPPNKMTERFVALGRLSALPDTETIEGAALHEILEGRMDYLTGIGGETPEAIGALVHAQYVHPVASALRGLRIYADRLTSLPYVAGPPTVNGIPIPTPS